MIRLNKTANAANTSRVKDSGMTLTELLISMGIFTTVIALFMGAVVFMTHNTARASAVSDSGDEVRRAFQRLDREVRYASAINWPGTGSGGTWYVEYLMSDVEAGEAEQCVQWRVTRDTHELQRRDWDRDTSAVSAWVTVASDVRNDPVLGDPEPFILRPANPQYDNQRLEIDLRIRPNESTDSAGAGLEAIFVARNTGAVTTTNSPSNPPVCLQGVGRP